LERVEDDQHSKEDTRGCVISLKVKLGVQDMKMKKPGRRIMKKQTKGKAAAGTGQHYVHQTGWHWTALCAPNRASPYFSA
jgi:hypothetical protein